jgi:hypothetical protein
MEVTIMTPRLLPVILILALSLSGCKIVVATKINPDGSGELRNQILYTAEESQSFAQTPGNEGKSLCDSLNDGLPAGTKGKFVEEKNGDETLCVAAQTFDSLDELRVQYGLMENVTVHRLDMAWGRFVFDVQVDTPETDSNGQPPAPTEWHLTVPGTLQANNAERVEDQVLKWTMTPGERTRMQAESAGAFGFNLPLVLGGAILAYLVVMGIAIGTFAFLSRQWKRGA